jgi:iron complex outermembrane receptor protein
MSQRSVRRMRAASLVAAALLSQAAKADEGPEDRREQGMPEIIVTAQKREERLQDVPIAISAFGSEQLQSRGISNISELNSLAPNVQISTATADNTGAQLSIRGAAEINPALFWDPTVGIYLDGVYIGKTLGSVFDLVELERIEVLRGPQGTLYGRNTLAGAINLVTRPPSGELSGHAEVSYGNYNLRGCEASLDLPQIGIAKISIGGRGELRDGTTQTRPGSSVSRLDNRDQTGARFALDLDFTDAFRAAYRFDYSDADQQPQNSYLLRADIPALAPYVSSSRLATVPIDGQSFERSQVNGHSLTLSWHGSDNTLKSISAYRSLKWDDALDLDGSPIPIADTSRLSTYHSLSQELQLVGNTERLKYVGGLYYFKDDGFTNNPQTYFYGTFNFNSTYGFSTRAWSGYGQLDFEATDALTLTAGVRYTQERKGIDRQLGVNFAAGAPFISLVPAGSTAAQTFSAITPLLTIAYEFSSMLNVYAKYAEGFKSGGFNGEFGDTGLPPDPRGLGSPAVVAANIAETRTPFNPEKVKSYELGLKTSLAQGRLRLNSAVFQNNTRDLQLSIFQATGAASSIITNAGKATTRGFELDGTWLPVDALRLQLGYGYLDAKYDEFIDNGVNVADDRAFVHAPKNTFNVLVDGRIMQSPWGKLHLLADYTWTDKFYTYPYQLASSGPQYNPAEQLAGNTLIPSIGMLNLRLLLKDIPISRGTTAQVSLWGRNVTNTLKVANNIDFGPSFGNLTVGYFTEPRTYGVDIEVHL